MIAFDSGSLGRLVQVMRRRLLVSAAVAEQHGSSGRALSLYGVYFQTNYYLDQNPDVAKSGMDPHYHFQKYGKYELRRPNPFIDLAFYKAHMMSKAYPAAYDNAFDHYINIGVPLDLWPSPFFDPVYYRRRYSSIQSGFMAFPLCHFLETGIESGCFDTHPCYENLA